MPWPPALPPASRADLTTQQTNHPNDHNVIADALAEIVDAVGGHIAAGYVASQNSDGDGDIVLTFPFEFASPPFVLAMARLQSTTSVVVAAQGLPTTTEVTIRTYTGTTPRTNSPCSFYWIAIGTPA